MPRPDRSTQVRISRTTADALRKLAADLGYVQTRGILAGELGSIAQMFDAVAQGKLAVVDPHTIDAAIARRIWPAQDHSERIRTWNEAIQAARSAVAVEMKGVRLSGESPHSDADSGAAPTPDPDRAHQDAQNG